MELRLAYGKEELPLRVPDKNLQAVLTPNAVPPGLTGTDEVRRALADPIGTGRLREIARAGEKLCIVTSDITRPMPTKTVLPELLPELAAAGARDGDITVVFALGNHRGHTAEERKRLMGEALYERLRCVDSDQSDVVKLGNTSLGTPVEVFREVAEADRIICLGNIEYHYFAGYSGGLKAIMPGVSTAAAIQINHRRMTEESAAAGIIEGNRVRSDIDEMSRFLKVDFILNVVLDEHKRILRAVAGDPVLAHREGCAFLDSLYRIRIRRRADIVVVSTGGYPKDINLYQAQKALDNAGRAVRDGGIVILCAACPEGLGEEIFARWMREARSPDDLVERVGRRFELGGHKAAAIGMVRQRAELYLVSGMDGGLVRSLFFTPFPDAQRALDHALSRLGGQAEVIVMPYGGSTLPCEAGTGG